MPNSGAPWKDFCSPFFLGGSVFGFVGLVGVVPLPPEPLGLEEPVLGVEGLEEELEELLLVVTAATLAFGSGSGVKGLRVGPPRWYCAPLVVSETAAWGSAGAGVASESGAEGSDAPSEALDVELAGALEPPPPRTA